MSLRDTIDGARREAQEAGVALPKKPEKAEKTDVAEDDEKRGFSRSSAAKAKPAREAASSVRVVSKSGGKQSAGPETKEEKRERRRKEREEEDLRNRAFDLIARSQPGYKQAERNFWIFMGVGLGLAVISIVASAVGDQQSMDLTTWQGVLSVVTLVAAYVCIIGGFIYDLRKRRPFRREAEARVRSLSDKKIAELFEKARKEQEKADAEKKAAKAKK